MPRQKNDILQGTLALLVLKTLAAQGRMHGYAVTGHIQRASGELLRVEEGSPKPFRAIGKPSPATRDLPKPMRT